MFRHDAAKRRSIRMIPGSGTCKLKCSSFKTLNFIRTQNGCTTFYNNVIYRGYYTVARRYEFYVRVARTISHE